MKSDLYSVMKCNPNVIEIHIVSYKMKFFVSMNMSEKTVFYQFKFS